MPRAKPPEPPRLACSTTRSRPPQAARTARSRARRRAGGCPGRPRRTSSTTSSTSGSSASRPQQRERRRRPVEGRDRQRQRPRVVRPGASATHCGALEDDVGVTGDDVEPDPAAVGAGQRRRAAGQRRHPSRGVGGEQLDAAGAGQRDVQAHLADVGPARPPAGGEGGEPGGEADPRAGRHAHPPPVEDLRRGRRVRRGAVDVQRQRGAVGRQDDAGEDRRRRPTPAIGPEAAADVRRAHAVRRTPARPPDAVGSLRGRGLAVRRRRAGGRRARRARSRCGCARARSTRSSASATCSPAARRCAGSSRATPRCRSCCGARPAPARRRSRCSSPARPRRRFRELSAVTAGVKDVRQVVDEAKRALGETGAQTVLFVDEVHRFSKTQQDALLPSVENRWVTLVAATTENPFFSVISPLLSRSLLLTLEPLTDDDVRTVVQRALADERGLGGRVTVDDDAVDHLVRLAGGDARRSLTALEAAAGAVRPRDARAARAGRRPGRRALRPRRRPALRRHQRLHQVDPRLRRRRLAALPGAHVRGGGGPALHRPPARRATPARTSAWPTRPRCRSRSPPRRRSS